MNFETLFVQTIAQRYFAKDMEDMANQLLQHLHAVVDEKKVDMNEFQMELFLSGYTKMITLLTNDPYSIIHANLNSLFYLDMNIIREFEASKLDLVNKMVDFIFEFQGGQENE